MAEADSLEPVAWGTLEPRAFAPAMPDAFPAVVMSIRQFLSSHMRAVTLETEAAFSWQAGGPWKAQSPT